jgi:hypothetical protein
MSDLDTIATDGSHDPDIRDLLAQAQREVCGENNTKSKGAAKRGQVTLAGMSAGTIYKTEFPPVEFAVEKILPVGLTLAAGRPKVGKSWAGLQFAVAVALGEPALGHFAVKLPGRVTYLALEEPPQRTHHRLRQIVPAYDVRLDNIQFLYEIQPLMTGGAVQLDNYLAANPSELVVIDTFLALVSAHSGRKDIVRGDYNEVNTLRQIAVKRNTAMLAITHSRKAPGDLVDAVLNTTGSTAACDSVWSLKRSSTTLTEGTLEVVGRDFEGTTYELRFNKERPFGWQVTAEGTDAVMSEERRDILILLQQEGAKRPAEVARMLCKNANTIRRLIQNMAGAGTIRRQSDGTYVPANGVNA